MMMSATRTSPAGAPFPFVAGPFRSTVGAGLTGVFLATVRPLPGGLNPFRIPRLHFHSACRFFAPQLGIQSGFRPFLPLSSRTSRNRWCHESEIPHSERNMCGPRSVLLFGGVGTFVRPVVCPPRRRRFLLKQIHPELMLTTVRCTSCGTTFTTRSTRRELVVDTCSNCHPAYTGVERAARSGSRIERFERRRQKARA